MIRTYSYPRAALIGNPSDGYFGKTIAFIFKNFEASVSIKESDRLQILPCDRDGLVFQDVHDLTQSVNENGYYGGVRLIKAAIKTFCEYCTAKNIQIPERAFTISYSSNIPNRLGLAGSSAIVTATYRAIMQFYDIDIPKPILANLILSAEKDELKIGAGLQDRVAQVYAEPVYMNFDRGLMKERGHGDYIPFDKSLLPNIYLAYRTDLSEGSEVLHNDLATRYARGEQAVLQAIEQWKECTDEVWQRLQTGNKDIAALIDRNFDIRSSVCTISEGNKALIDTARSVGASSKFTGSGGAIIGTYNDEKMFDELVNTMEKINAVVIKPEIA